MKRLLILLLCFLLYSLALPICLKFTCAPKTPCPITLSVGQIVQNCTSSTFSFSYQICNDVYLLPPSPLTLSTMDVQQTIDIISVIPSDPSCSVSSLSPLSLFCNYTTLVGCTAQNVTIEYDFCSDPDNCSLDFTLESSYSSFALNVSCNPSVPVSLDCIAPVTCNNSFCNTDTVGLVECILSTPVNISIEICSDQACDDSGPVLDLTCSLSYLGNNLCQFSFIGTDFNTSQCQIPSVPGGLTPTFFNLTCCSTTANFTSDQFFVTMGATGYNDSINLCIAASLSSNITCPAPPCPSNPFALLQGDIVAECVPGYQIGRAHV